MANDRAVVGDHNIICHRCSRKIKASHARKEPRTGLYVCQDHLDYWHPLERGPETPREDIGTPWTRSQQIAGTETFGTGDANAEFFDGPEIFDDTSTEDPITTATLQAGDADNAVVTKA